MPEEPVALGQPGPVALAEALLSVLAKLYVSDRRDEMERRAAGELTDAHYAVLRMVAEQKSVRVSELARTAGVTMPTMSITVSRLITRGLLCRPSPNPVRRNSRVAFTPYGAWVFEASTRSRHRSLQTRLLRLSPEDQQTVSAAVQVLRRMLGSQATSECGEGTGFVDTPAGGSERL